MAFSNTEIEALNEEIQKSQQELKRLHILLGTAVYDSGVLLFENERSKVELAQRKEQNAYQKIVTLKKTYQQIEESGNSIKQARVKLRSLEEKTHNMYQVLGALATEIYDRGNFPTELVSCLQPIISFKNEQSQLSTSVNNSKFFLRKALLKAKHKKRQKKVESVYFEVGKAVNESKYSNLLEGERVNSVFDKLNEIQNLQDTFTQEISYLSENISKAKDSLSKQETIRVKELQNDHNRTKEDLDLALLNYGETLSKYMKDWVVEGCPDEIVDLCIQINNKNRKIEVISLQKRMSNFEKQNALSSERINKYNETINYLDSQIKTIQKQRQELAIKIDEERQQINNNTIQLKVLSDLIKDSTDV